MSDQDTEEDALAHQNYLECVDLLNWYHGKRVMDAAYEYVTPTMQHETFRNLIESFKRQFHEE